MCKTVEAKVQTARKARAQKHARTGKVRKKPGFSDESTPAFRRNFA
jgi:hypothetical protein